jgi:hypothetical protein
MGVQEMIGKLACFCVAVLAGVALLAGFAPCLADQADPISLHKIQPVVARHTYDPARLPAGMPATQPDEAGVTVSDFSCVAEARGHLISATQTPTVVIASAELDAVEITLKLKVDEWVDKSAGEKTWRHEDGHRQISLRFDAHAEETAEIIAHGYVDHVFSAPGADAATAGRAALAAAAQKITDDYMAAVRDQSELVQEAYDRITQHGTNVVDEYDAIQEALAEVAREKPPNAPIGPAN